MRFIKMGLALVFILFSALGLYRSIHAPHAASASSSGPPPSRTGAPPEGDCALCHFSYMVNDPSGGAFLDGLPKSYTPGGDPIVFTVTVFQDGTDGIRKDWGFELTVIDDTNRRFAGTLVAIDDVHTQIISNTVEGSNRDYIEQTSAGIYFNPEGSDSATWCIAWIPPDEDVGSVTFYAATNAGNGDFFPLGDYIFTTHQTVAGPDANVAACSPPYRPAGAPYTRTRLPFHKGSGKFRPTLAAILADRFLTVRALLQHFSG